MILFAEYLKLKIRTIILLLVFAGVFFVVFALYKLPLEAVAYPVILCVFIGIVYLVIDFFRIKKRHEELELLSTLTISAIDSLPTANGIIEEDYRKVLKHLQAESSKVSETDYLRLKDMEEYYSMWAHQIKTPIAAMKLTLQNEDSELSRRLSGELNRIEQYVEMVLAYLRLDSSSTDYVFKEYELDEIIKVSVKKFTREFISRKLSLTYNVNKTKIITDDKWLSFVVEQLLSNALKYTKKGGISIYNQAETILVIEDTGIGISADNLPRIFEKGYTGYNGREDKAASGIGLYLVKRVCDKLGAKIWAESEVGKGTKMMLDLSNYKGL